MKVFMTLLSVALLANHVRAASIIFPGEEEPPKERRRQLIFKETPKCAKNPTGICSGRNNVPDYPSDLVRLAAGNVKDAELTEITRGDELVSNLSLGLRFGGSVHDDNNLVEETAACAASEEIIYPTMAMNSKKEWLYVANTAESITQGIRVEKCLEEGKPCKIGEAGTTCRQKYIYRKLIAVDANEKLEADNFRIPSTCVCYIKNEYILLTRFKGNNRNSTKSSSSKRSRSRRQAPNAELEITGGEADGLTGSPLDNTLGANAPAQGTAQQSIETEETLNPSDTIGNKKTRYAGEIIVESNPILVQKKPKTPRRRN